MASFWACSFISLPGLFEAPVGAVVASVVGTCVAVGLLVPDMEATRNRTPEAEGLGIERAFELGLCDGPDRWYTARVGPQQAEHPQGLSSPLSVSRSASWQVAGAGTHNAQPGPGGVPADMRRLR